MSTYPCSIECDIQGLSIVDQGPEHNGKRYKARAWDKHKRKHDNRSFHTLKEAEDFGRSKLAKFELRLDSAGALSIASVREDFMTYLAGKEIGANQITKYALVLDRLTKEANINSLKAPDLVPRTQAWLNTLRCGKVRKRPGLVASALSATTKERYVVLLKAFGDWVRLHKEQYKNPFELLVAPTQEKKSKSIFSIDECRAMVSDQALRHEHGLFYAVALYTGMRQQEIAWMRSSSIMWNQKRIRVSLHDAVDQAEGTRLRPKRPLRKHVKGKKERDVILPDELAEILAKIVPAGDAYLFPECYRKGDSHWYNRALDGLCAHLGMERGQRTTHNARHTNVCLYLAAGLDSTFGKEHWGHEDLNTTTKYAKHALSMREQAKHWGAEIRLRQPVSECKGSATKPANQEQARADGCDEPISEEDDLNDCQIVILPDHSPIFRHSAIVPVCVGQRTHNPSVSGSSPDRPTTISLPASAACDEEEDIGNPS